MDSYWDWLPLELKDITISFIPSNLIYNLGYITPYVNLHTFQLSKNWECIFKYYPYFYKDCLHKIAESFNVHVDPGLYEKYLELYKDIYSNFNLPHYLSLSIITYDYKGNLSITFGILTNDNNTKYYITCNDVVHIKLKLIDYLL
jgi:hypothetical protein